MIISAVLISNSALMVGIIENQSGGGKRGFRGAFGYSGGRPRSTNIGIRRIRRSEQVFKGQADLIEGPGGDTDGVPLGTAWAHMLGVV